MDLLSALFKTVGTPAVILVRDGAIYVVAIILRWAW